MIYKPLQASKSCIIQVKQDVRANLIQINFVLKHLYFHFYLHFFEGCFKRIIMALKSADITVLPSFMKLCKIDYLMSRLYCFIIIYDQQKTVDSLPNCYFWAIPFLKEHPSCLIFPIVTIDFIFILIVSIHKFHFHFFSFIRLTCFNNTKNVKKKKDLGHQISVLQSI